MTQHESALHELAERLTDTDQGLAGGALLVEANDEMIASERRYIAAASVAVLLDDDQQLSSLPAAPRN